MSNESKDATYNGWANYETWATYSWLTNEPVTYYALYKIVARGGTKSERGDALKDYVEEVYNMPTTGLAGDLIMAALQEVNWLEIIGNCEEDGVEL